MPGGCCGGGRRARRRRPQRTYVQGTDWILIQYVGRRCDLHTVHGRGTGTDYYVDATQDEAVIAVYCEDAAELEQRDFRCLEDR